MAETTERAAISSPIIRRLIVGMRMQCPGSKRIERPPMPHLDLSPHSVLSATQVCYFRVYTDVAASDVERCLTQSLKRRKWLPPRRQAGVR